MQRSHFIDKENTRKTSVRAHVYVSKVFGNTVLVRLKYCPVAKSISRGDDLAMKKLKYHDLSANIPLKKLQQ